MKKVFLIIFLTSLLGCNFESELYAIESMRDNKKVWVFSHFNVPQQGNEPKSYYYYAQVSKKLYEAISYNEINSGFIHLANVKYWGDDDLIYEYQDIENSGDIIFRIENIAKLEQVNVAPIAGKGYEQFQEPQEQEPQKQEPQEQESEVSTDLQES